MVVGALDKRLVDELVVALLRNHAVPVHLINLLLQVVDLVDSSVLVAH